MGSTPPPPTGGGGNPTPSPSPSPSPTPPPTGVNTSLDGTLQSETFANVASRAAANFTADDSTGTVTNKVTAEIIYDAGSRSYRLKTPTGSITFAQGDIDSSQSNSDVTVYVKTSGNQTDSLTLTRTGAGGVKFSYVGAAFWQRSVVNTTTGTGAIDSIVYGVKTPNADVPRTGQASYDLTLYGARTFGPNLFPLAGTGAARVDFGSGQIFLIGSMQISDGDPGRNVFAFSGDATLSSSANSFSGSFTFTDFQTFDGQFNGMFFGPGAEELGATWTASDGLGDVATGAILGRRGNTTSNSSFQPGSPALAESELFIVKEAGIAFNMDGSPGRNDTVGAITNVSGASGDISIFFDNGSNTYQLRLANGLSDVFNDSGAVKSAPVGFSEWFPGTAYTYVAPGGWRYSSNQISPAFRYSYHVYGMPTPDADVPRTGNAGYALRFDGRVVDPDYLNPFIIGGTGILRADFATGALDLTGSLNIHENYFMSGRQPVTFTSALNGTGTLSSTTNSFNGSLSFGGVGNYTGTFDGKFFGPTAQEVGGVFSAKDNNGSAAGNFVGRRDDTITDADRTLAGATEPLNLTGYSIRDGIYVNAVAARFDPATGNYRVTFDRGGINENSFTLSETRRDSANSTPSRDAYYFAGDPGLRGFLSVVGEDNPEIQLSYLTFGRIQRLDRSGNAFSNYYTVFGLETPSSTLPRAGNATYSGILIGDGYNANTGYRGTVSGTSSIDADFGMGSLIMILNMEQDDAAGTAIGTFQYDGTIANNGFFGSIDRMTSGGPTGNMRGGFFGPNADEYGAVFDVLHDQAAGRSTYSGVAVGKKN